VTGNQRDDSQSSWNSVREEGRETKLVGLGSNVAENGPGPIRCPETLVKDYRSTLLNNPEDHRSHQHRAEA
jgi:hypothetical protein